MNIPTLSAGPVSIPSLLLNLALGVLLSIVLAWYYVRFGHLLANRTQFAPVLPLLTLITLLVITVVKSSLALSLGLVGALSIVRFRTAIKDPEELVFLFFAISIGLGLGADQRVPTLVVSAVIFIYLVVQERFRLVQRASHGVYLNIEPSHSGSTGELFGEINQLLVDGLTSVNLQRLDSREGSIQLTYRVSVSDPDVLVATMDALRKQMPHSAVSIVEQSNLLGG